MAYIPQNKDEKYACHVVCCKHVIHVCQPGTYF